VLFFFSAAHCDEAGEFDINYPRSHLRVGAYLQIPEVQNWSGCEGQRFAPICPLGSSRGREGRDGRDGSSALPRISR
jgi:hypothetical protein